MKFSPLEDFLVQAESSAALKKLLKARESTLLTEIAEPAQPFVTALLLRGIPERTWVVCPDLKMQEEFAIELAAWCPRVRLFPDLELPTEDSLPDAETLSERLELLRRLSCVDGNEVVVIHSSQWTSSIPAPKSIHGGLFQVSRGDRLSIEELESVLEKSGYDASPLVTSRGQFARRGGILDLFSWQQARPVRFEWFDLEIDSLREFDLDTQASVQVLETVEIYTGDMDKADAILSDYRRKGDRIITLEPSQDFEGVGIASGGDNLKASTAFYPPPFGDLGAGDLVLNEAKRDRFFNQLHAWSADRWTLAFTCVNEGEGERFRELACDFDFDTSNVLFLTSRASRGFVCPKAKIALLAESEVLGRSATQRAQRAALRRERVRSGRTAMDFSDFEPGDLVVHLDHGIGRFEGLEKSPDGSGDVLLIEFANDARLYVPLDQAWQVARYVGLGKKHPDLSELGNARWSKAKEKATHGIYEYAARMLKVQAERETTQGHAFSADSHWQQEFERSFLFTETPDQLRAIRETKADMESQQAMDRLICGDVGFGKTEVAIRAAFKGVTGGCQVAVIAPTTVLAQQHWRTFRERMSEYPVTVELLNRFRTPAEQKQIIKSLREGGIDIVVGTHRVISADVEFKNLGLVIVDEEQRFGVKHKDALKEKFRLVDVLTLSATPIPRTLYLSLMGARDMSLIETPPTNRQPVETIVCAYDERVIRDAVTREIARGGQVYFLHNRVQSIERVAARIRELCQGCRVLVGHGQMAQGELEVVMRHFVAGDADVLVSTTIIESGLDIPNANTIIIDRADRFGLADLYQLRGRVGRSGTKAHAYLMLPRDLMSVGAARRRVSAIKQYSELGSGFKIAMRDLEIRGAGNLLGTEQSGHIIAVGFDLYCKMLKRAMDALKGTRTFGATTAMRLDFATTEEGAFIPSDNTAPSFLPFAYISDAKLRIEAYRRLAEAATRADLDNLKAEWRDRFGLLPRAVENALVCAAIRIEASTRRIRQVESRDDKLMLMRGSNYVLIGGRFPRLTAPEPDFKLREVLAFLENMQRR